MDFVVFLVNFVFSTYYILLVIRIFWPRLPLNDPLVGMLRKALPPDRMGMDVSPFIALILVWLVQRMILSLLI